MPALPREPIKGLPARISHFRLLRNRVSTNQPQPGSTTNGIQKNGRAWGSKNSPSIPSKPPMQGTMEYFFLKKTYLRMPARLASITRAPRSRQQKLTVERLNVKISLSSFSAFLASCFFLASLPALRRTGLCAACGQCGQR